MARKRAESMDQASFWAVNAAGAPGKRCRPIMASPRPGRMIGFTPFHGFIRGMPVNFTSCQIGSIRAASKSHLRLNSG